MSRRKTMPINITARQPRFDLMFATRVCISQSFPITTAGTPSYRATKKATPSRKNSRRSIRHCSCITHLYFTGNVSVAPSRFGVVSVSLISPGCFDDCTYTINRPW